MGCDCHGKLKGWVKPEEVVKALEYLGYTDINNEVEPPKESWLLKEFHDRYPEERWVMNPSYPESDYYVIVSGFISFKAFEEDRMIHYFYTNECDFSMLQDLPENEDKSKDEITPMELTSLSVRMWGHSTEIIKSVLSVLGGGYIDENDCDDIPPYFLVPRCDIRRQLI